VALSSENFGEAMNHMARYKQLTCPEEIVQEKNGEEWSVQFHWLLASEIEPPVLIECAFAWVLSTARVGTGTRLSPLRVEFVQPREHARNIERHFGCPVVWGASRNAIVFRAADAERPFVTRNAELLGILAPQLERELNEENEDEDFGDRVRITIQQKLTGRRPTVEDIADALHVSARTLQRRLQDQGSSFQRVLEEARHQLARQYLNNSVLELNEAAYLLGYNDANSFVRAFRTWEGVPPARWREEHRAKAAL
jgi:AraC-like DNA-binding protein